MAGVRISDPDLARRLVLHEARAQQTPTRVLRDLGDAWLFHDPDDAEPFWNRVIAPRWPGAPRQFDKRLDEVITLFATLGRLPHVRPLPVGGEPVDLADRLRRAGFESMGEDRRMVHAEPEQMAAIVADAEARVSASFGAGVVRVSRHPTARAGAGSTSRWADRRRWAAEASLVLGDAFAVDPARRLALENDVLACVARPGCSVLLLHVGDEPAAIGRRASTIGGSYLSSIGTRPRFRGRGLGALATALAMADGLAGGSSLIHLAVETDNHDARRLYERLGFVVVGDPTPDLLLR